MLFTNSLSNLPLKRNTKLREREREIILYCISLEFKDIQGLDQ